MFKCTDPKCAWEWETTASETGMPRRIPLPDQGGFPVAYETEASVGAKANGSGPLFLASHKG